MTMQLVVGIGVRSGTSAATIRHAIAEVLSAQPNSMVVLLATVDRRAAEPGLVAVARELGVAVVSFTPQQLAVVEVPNPSQHTLRALGTPSVAEAAAMLAGSELVTPKRLVDGVVVAAARKV